MFPARTLGLLLLAAICPAGWAGTLDRAELERHFPPPLEVGEREQDVPAWPVYLSEGPGGARLVAWAFESVDLAPVPGFAGVPPNLLIALRPNGEFMDVRVLSHHEPVFLDGLGEAPLLDFVGQYRDRSLYQGIKVGSSMDRHAGGSTRVFLDGVSKATASVRIVNETVLAAAARVARAKLGLGAADPGALGTVRQDGFEPLDWDGLLERGLVGHLRLTNAEVESAFAGTPGAGTDPAALADPQAAFIDLYVAHLNAPAVGRNLYGEPGYAGVRERFWDGEHIILVMARGRYDFMPEDFVPGAVPDRLSLVQNGLPLELRDSGYEGVVPGMAGLPDMDRSRLLEVPFAAGLDPSRPWSLSLQVTRSKGQIYPQRVVKTFTVDYRLPDALVQHADAPSGPPWLQLWRERALDIGIVAAMLLALAAGLGRQRWLAASAARLRGFRLGYLAFTLVFIGWYAQGQLSILNVTGLVQAVTGGGDLSFLLYDPITLLIWVFVLATAVAWGRGPFCGWLCPFGALQEFVGEAARRLRLPQWRPGEITERRLGRIKYGLLGLILVAAVGSLGAETMAEVEPFKTAITLGFQRSAPFVLYALATLALGLFVYKGYCRFLCPLGAALAVLGRVRALDWLARRAECGSACQLCRRRCEYGAIERSGAIRYHDCFQCLDCVAIYHDSERCAPLLLEKRKGRRVGIPVAVEAAAGLQVPARR